MAEGEGHADDGGSLAAKLDRLFRTVHPRGREEYSYRDVARAIEERGGPTISHSYLQALRTGQKDNPTKRHLEAIADFFGVSPAYFFDDEHASRIEAQLELLEAMRDAGIRHIALRAKELSPGAIDMIKELVERTRLIEGIEQAPPSPPPTSAPEPPAEPP